MTKLFTLIAALFVVSCAGAPAQAQEGNFYGGTSVGYERDVTAGAFAGYEGNYDVIYYATEVEYGFGDRDSVAISVRTGTSLATDITGYGVFGYGWQTGVTNINGVRYGLGGKYKINENFFAGLEFVHQELNQSSYDSTNLRIGFKF